MSSDLRRHYKKDPEDSSSSAESNDAVRGQRARLDQASRRDRTGAKRNILGSTIKHLLLWNLEIFNLVLRLMKKPIEFIICSILVALIFSFTAPFIGSLFIDAIAPVCHLPGLFGTNQCEQLLGRAGKGRSRYGEPKFDELVKIQLQFDSLLNHISLGAHLGMEMKRSESAVRDLSAVVGASDLKSKKELESSLNELASSMKQAVPLLSKMEAAMDGTVDYIIIVDELAIKTLQTIKDGTKSDSLALYAPWPFSPPSSANKKVLDAFVYAATALTRDVARLIQLSTAVSKKLDIISVQLNVMNRIVHLEKKNNKAGVTDLLVELWTMLGGDRTTLPMFESNFALLAELQRYHKGAVEYINEVEMHLQRVSNQLQLLEGGVKRTVGSTASSNKGVEKAAELEMSIQQLHQGITRLTDCKSKARQRKDRMLQRIVDGARYIDLRGI